MNMPDRDEERVIVSPFAVGAPGAGAGRPAAWAGRVGAAVGALALVVLGGWWGLRSAADPMRTLEEFPAAKYFDGHRALAGLRFRADLQVEADMGWKEGVGRLMLFTAPGESRALVVLVPDSLGNIHFTKGQKFEGEVAVKDGGLIVAASCRKL